jgi:HK97 family phage major capsid protein
MRHDLLIAQRDELLAQTQKIFDDGTTNDVLALSAEQKKQVKGNLDQLDQLDLAIKASTPNNRITTPDRLSGGLDMQTMQSRGGLSFRDLKTGEIVHSLAAGQPVYREQKDINAGRCLHAILSNDFSQVSDDERQMLAAHGGSDTAGGYLLPTPLSEIFVDLARSASVVMRAGATTLPMTTSELLIARLDSDPTATWRGETVAVTNGTADGFWQDRRSVQGRGLRLGVFSD